MPSGCLGVIATFSGLGQLQVLIIVHAHHEDVVRIRRRDEQSQRLFFLFGFFAFSSASSSSGVRLLKTISVGCGPTRIFATPYPMTRCIGRPYASAQLDTKNVFPSG